MTTTHRFLAVIAAAASALALAACSPEQADLADDAAPVRPSLASAAPDPRAGERLYATYCASCHGLRGEGDGPAGAALHPKPVRHGDGTYMNALSNRHLFKVVQQGGPSVGKSPLMAPWGGTLSDKEIWDVLAFVRSLADPPYTGSVP